MRGLTLTCAALCIVAAPAQAKTYNGMAFAGPTISGDSVVWGTEYTDGSGAVKVDGRVVARFERMTGDGEKRQFGGTPGAGARRPRGWRTASRTRVSSPAVTATPGRARRASSHWCRSAARPSPTPSAATARM